MILGKNLIVMMDGEVMAGAKTCNLDISQSFITACSPTEARVMEKIPTTYEWGISVDFLMPNSELPNQLTNYLIEGKKVFLTFTDGSDQKRAGFAYIKSCKQSGSIGSLATFSATFETTGALYRYSNLTRTQAFDEGYEKGLYIRAEDNKAYVYPKGSQSQMMYSSFQISQGQKLLIIYAIATWCISNDTWTHIKNYISATPIDNSALQAKYVTQGEDTYNEILTLPAGYYYMLHNEDDGLLMYIIE